MKTIFCPNCGKKNKKETKFCRSCGEELPKIKLKIGGKDELDKITKLNKMNAILVSLCAMFCSFFSLYLVLNDIVKGSFIPLLFSAISIILTFSIIIGVKTKRYLMNLNITKDFEKSDHHQNELVADTKELLHEADFTNTVPPSVVENTTRKLKTKIIDEN